MELKQQIDQWVADAKKEYDRLADRRTEDLGNGINYVENEMQMEHLLGKIEALEEVHNHLS